MQNKHNYMQILHKRFRSFLIKLPHVLFYKQRKPNKKGQRSLSFSILWLCLIRARSLLADGRRKAQTAYPCLGLFHLQISSRSKPYR